MAYFHSPRIVTDGLVLALDAGNTKSYPGSGTNWVDLSKKNPNLSLLNGTTYSSVNGGTIVFDGTNDLVRATSFSADTPNDSLSVFCWIYPTNLSNYNSSGTFFNWIINKRTGNLTPRDWQFLSSNSKLSVNIYDASDTSISSHTASNGTYTLQLNKWQYVGFTTSGINGGNLDTYYNGQLNLQSTLSGNRSKRELDMDIGKAGWTGSFYWTGNMATVFIYNRNLTAIEILQNYNATKGRYGL
jgi:hypothetical protein